VEIANISLIEAYSACDEFGFLSIIEASSKQVENEKTVNCYKDILHSLDQRRALLSSSIQE
jgi:hypothetical protein